MLFGSSGDGLLHVCSEVAACWFELDVCRVEYFQQLVKCLSMRGHLFCDMVSKPDVLSVIGPQLVLSLASPEYISSVRISLPRLFTEVIKYILHRRQILAEIRKILADELIPIGYRYNTRFYVRSRIPDLDPLLKLIRRRLPLVRFLLTPKSLTNALNLPRFISISIS